MSDKALQTIKISSQDKGYKPNSYHATSTPLSKMSVLGPSKFTFDKLTAEMNKDLSKKDIERLKTPLPNIEEITTITEVKEFPSPQKNSLRNNSRPTSPLAIPKTPLTRSRTPSSAKNFHEIVDNCSDGWKSQLEEIQKNKTKREQTKPEWKRIMDMKDYQSL